MVARFQTLHPALGIETTVLDREANRTQFRNLDELGLNAPKTWAEEKANCARIVAGGRACNTIGTKFLWTAGGWFDDINMRKSGFDFHMDLPQGKQSRESDQMRASFANWRALIDMGVFIANHQTYSWQKALPFMVKGEAAAHLKGNFAVAP